MDIICAMREDNYHNNDEILSLGEISDNLYFVTKGAVGIYVNLHKQYQNEYSLDDSQSHSSRHSSASRSHQSQFGYKHEANTQQRYIRIGILNVGSNFNHLSAILS